MNKTHRMPRQPISFARHSPGVLIEPLENRQLLSTNLIVNGSFETPKIGRGKNTNDFSEYAAGHPIGSGWKVTAGGVDIVTNSPGGYFASTPAAGNQYVDVAGFVPSPPAALAQTVTTTVGRQYTLQFAYTDTPFISNANDVELREMSVLENGTALGTISKDIFSGITPADPGWSYIDYTFTATVHRTAIAFDSITGGEEGIALDDVSLVEQPVVVNVDLSAAVSFFTPKTLSLKPGKTTSVAVKVFNNGTSRAKGPLQIALSSSANIDGSSPIVDKTFNVPLNLLAGASKTFYLPEKVPVGTLPQVYYATAVVDPADTFAETNTTNNSAFSSNTLTVVSPYINLLGTFSGTYHITRGVDKGAIESETRTYTSEDETDGAFSGNGTNFLTDGTTENFTFSGTITTAGVYISNAVLIPEGAFGIIQNKAKATATTLKGTFKNDLNSGTFSLTRVL